MGFSLIFQAFEYLQSAFTIWSSIFLQKLKYVLNADKTSLMVFLNQK